MRPNGGKRFGRTVDAAIKNRPKRRVAPKAKRRKRKTTGGDRTILAGALIPCFATCHSFPVPFDFLDFDRIPAW
jgi:hypothetical protein